MQYKKIITSKSYFEQIYAKVYGLFQVKIKVKKKKKKVESRNENRVIN